MKFYLAPMQGVTGYIYRDVYSKFFSNIDKYFSPFITPSESKRVSKKELKDVLPQNNQSINLIPQILTNSSNGFSSTCEKLKDLGYNEVNINLGCPSKTVVSKNKGSGFLANTEELDRFLDEIFKVNDMKISIKTRLGVNEAEEIYKLLEVYNKYPLLELIVHPRTQRDFYDNTPDMAIFKDVFSLSQNPICYNGDIYTVYDYNELTKSFKYLESTMIGRGIIRNPGLIDLIKNNKKLDKVILRNFHDEILSKYIETFKDDKNALFRMKELWWYMSDIFTDNKKYAKKIKKSQTLDAYNNAVLSLFNEQEILDS